MGLPQIYENPYLSSVYQFGRTGVNATYPEYRISLLYNLLDKRIMPWMWDTDHYMDENKDMVGYFYPEDFGTILQIAHFESQRKDKK